MNLHFAVDNYDLLQDYFDAGLVYTSGLSAGYVFGKLAATTAIADLGL